MLKKHGDRDSRAPRATHFCLAMVFGQIPIDGVDSKPRTQIDSVTLPQADASPLLASDGDKLSEHIIQWNAMLVPHNNIKVQPKSQQRTAPKLTLPLKLLQDLSSKVKIHGSWWTKNPTYKDGEVESGWTLARSDARLTVVVSTEAGNKMVAGLPEKGSGEIEVFMDMKGKMARRLVIPAGYKDSLVTACLAWRDSLLPTVQKLYDIQDPENEGKEVIEFSCYRADKLEADPSYEFFPPPAMAVHFARDVLPDADIGGDPTIMAVVKGSEYRWDVVGEQFVPEKDLRLSLLGPRSIPKLPLKASNKEFSKSVRDRVRGLEDWRISDISEKEGLKIQFADSEIRNQICVKQNKIWDRECERRKTQTLILGGETNIQWRVREATELPIETGRWKEADAKTMKLIDQLCKKDITNLLRSIDSLIPELIEAPSDYKNVRCTGISLDRLGNRWKLGTEVDFCYSTKSGRRREARFNIPNSYELN